MNSNVNDTKYRLSRWCKKFVNKDIVAFYHSLSLYVLFVPRGIAENILQILKSPISLNQLSIYLDKKTLQIFVREGLVVKDNYDEMQDLLELREKLRNNTSLEVMYVLVTDDCNMKCKYCFEETPKSKYGFRSVMMNEKTAINSVRKFAKLTSLYGRPEIKKTIQIYGGEPLLNFSAIQSIVLELNKLQDSGEMSKECDISVVTNGTMFDDEMARFFASNGVSIAISIDGPKELNDLYRIPKCIKLNSYDNAVNAYKLAISKGVGVGISATLTPEILGNFDFVLDFFINDLGIKNGIGFNILHFNPGISLGSDYYEEAARCLIKAFEKFRMLNIHEERMMRKAEAFISRSVIYADCGIVGNQIVVSPDGKVGVCQDFVKPRTYFEGSVNDELFDPVEYGIFNHWKERSPLFMEECYDCEALGICGGGCPASIELNTGNRWDIDRRICPHSKLSLEWLIWDMYMNIRES